MKQRSEAEMLALISGFAQDDDRIRTVLLNGSRANPSAERDIFQDYDVANFVTDVDPFRNYDFIRSHFGEAIMVQTPEDKEAPPALDDGRYNYNMQLVDGNRIDLSFFPLDRLQELAMDSLTVVLFDKDERLTDLMPPSESSYFLSEPTERLYLDCCDEFLFGLGSHIPKTLWRRSLPLLHFYIDVVLRRPLVTMLGWEIGTRTGFDRSIGKSGNKLKEFLPPEQWQQFLRTYPDSDLGHIWESIELLYNLFMSSAEYVAGVHGYAFPAETGRKAWAFLEHVHLLPQDATSIY